MLLVGQGENKQLKLKAIFCDLIRGLYWENMHLTWK